MSEMHSLVKRLLDGELGLAELPVELRAEGEWALRLLAAADRRDVRLGAGLDARVMAAVRRAAPEPSSAWRWIVRPFELRLAIRPWAALAAAAVLILLVVARPFGRGVPSASRAAVPESVVVRFVLYAPSAHAVSVAGSFNQWDRGATPLVPAGHSGLWAATVTLAPGQHQYAFVVDGRQWVVDPGAPAVDDGFGRRNSLITVGAPAGDKSL